MSSGGFEFESLRLLKKRGHTPERLDADAIAKAITGSHRNGPSFFGLRKNGQVKDTKNTRAKSESRSQKAVGKSSADLRVRLI